MLDHLALDDDTAPNFAAAYSAAAEANALMKAAFSEAVSSAIVRMTEALMGEGQPLRKLFQTPAPRIDTKPAVAGLLAETPAGRYRGIGWCDGA